VFLKKKKYEVHHNGTSDTIDSSNSGDGNNAKIDEHHTKRRASGGSSPSDIGNRKKRIRPKSMVFSGISADIPVTSKREKRKSRKSYNFELTENDSVDFSSNSNINNNDSALDVLKDERRRSRRASPIPASLIREIKEEKESTTPKKTIKSREGKEKEKDKELKETKERKDSRKRKEKDLAKKEKPKT